MDGLRRSKRFRQKAFKSGFAEKVPFCEEGVVRIPQDQQLSDEETIALHVQRAITSGDCESSCQVCLFSIFEEDGEDPSCIEIPGDDEEEDDLLADDHPYNGVNGVAKSGRKNNKKKKQIALLLNCKHIFHASCILQWTEQENSCPFCKDKFNQIGIYNVPSDKELVQGYLMFDHLAQIEEKNQAISNLIQEGEAEEERRRNRRRQEGGRGGTGGHHGRDTFEKLLCRICHKDNDPETMVLCDVCGDTYHPPCVGFPDTEKMIAQLQSSGIGFTCVNCTTKETAQQGNNSASRSAKTPACGSSSALQANATTKLTTKLTGLSSVKEEVEEVESDSSDQEPKAKKPKKDLEKDFIKAPLKQAKRINLDDSDSSSSSSRSTSSSDDDTSQSKRKDTQSSTAQSSNAVAAVTQPLSSVGGRTTTVTVRRAVDTIPSAALSNNNSNNLRGQRASTSQPSRGKEAMEEDEDYVPDSPDPSSGSSDSSSSESDDDGPDSLYSNPEEKKAKEVAKKEKKRADKAEKLRLKKLKKVEDQIDSLFDDVTKSIEKMGPRKKKMLAKTATGTSSLNLSTTAAYKVNLLGNSLVNAPSHSPDSSSMMTSSAKVGGMTLGSITPPQQGLIISKTSEVTSTSLHNLGNTSIEQRQPESGHGQKSLSETANNLRNLQIGLSPSEHKSRSQPTQLSESRISEILKSYPPKQLAFEIESSFPLTQSRENMEEISIRDFVQWRNGEEPELDASSLGLKDEELERFLEDLESLDFLWMRKDRFRNDRFRKDRFRIVKTSDNNLTTKSILYLCTLTKPQLYFDGSLNRISHLYDNDFFSLARHFQKYFCNWINLSNNPIDSNAARMFIRLVFSTLLKDAVLEGNREAWRKKKRKKRQDEKQQEVKDKRKQELGLSIDNELGLSIEKDQPLDFSLRVKKEQIIDDDIEHQKKRPKISSMERFNVKKEQMSDYIEMVGTDNEQMGDVEMIDAMTDADLLGLPLLEDGKLEITENLPFDNNPNEPLSFKQPLWLDFSNCRITDVDLFLDVVQNNLEHDLNATIFQCKKEKKTDAVENLEYMKKNSLVCLALDDSKCSGVHQCCGAAIHLPNVRNQQFYIDPSEPSEIAMKELEEQRVILKNNIAGQTKNEQNRRDMISKPQINISNPVRNPVTKSLVLNPFSIMNSNPFLIVKDIGKRSLVRNNSNTQQLQMQQQKQLQIHNKYVTTQQRNQLQRIAMLPPLGKLLRPIMMDPYSDIQIIQKIDIESNTIVDPPEVWYSFFHKYLLGLHGEENIQGIKNPQQVIWNSLSSLEQGYINWIKQGGWRILQREDESAGGFRVEPHTIEYNPWRSTWGKGFSSSRGGYKTKYAAMFKKNVGKQDLLLESEDESDAEFLLAHGLKPKNTERVIVYTDASITIQIPHLEFKGERELENKKSAKKFGMSSMNTVSSIKKNTLNSIVRRVSADHLVHTQGDTTQGQGNTQTQGETQGNNGGNSDSRLMRSSQGTPVKPKLSDAEIDRLINTQFEQTIKKSNDAASQAGELQRSVNSVEASATARNRLLQGSSSGVERINRDGLFTTARSDSFTNAKLASAKLASKLEIVEEDVDNFTSRDNFISGSQYGGMATGSGSLKRNSSSATNSNLANTNLPSSSSSLQRSSSSSSSLQRPKVPSQKPGTQKLRPQQITTSALDGESQNRKLDSSDPSKMYTSTVDKKTYRDPILRQRLDAALDEKLAKKYRYIKIGKQPIWSDDIHTLVTFENNLKQEKKDRERERLERERQLRERQSGADFDRIDNKALLTGRAFTQKGTSRQGVFGGVSGSTLDSSHKTLFLDRNGKLNLEEYDREEILQTGTAVMAGSLGEKNMSVRAQLARNPNMVLPNYTNAMNPNIIRQQRMGQGNNMNGNSMNMNGNSMNVNGNSMNMNGNSMNMNGNNMNGNSMNMNGNHMNVNTNQSNNGNGNNTDDVSPSNMILTSSGRLIPNPAMQRWNSSHPISNPSTNPDNINSRMTPSPTPRAGVGGSLVSVGGNSVWTSLGTYNGLETPMARATSDEPNRRGLVPSRGIGNTTNEDHMTIATPKIEDRMTIAKLIKKRFKSTVHSEVIKQINGHFRSELQQANMLLSKAVDIDELIWDHEKQGFKEQLRDIPELAAKFTVEELESCISHLENSVKFKEYSYKEIKRKMDEEDNKLRRRR